jgi:uncharacterized membrane protein YhhN
LPVSILVLLIADFAGHLISIKNKNKIGIYITKPLLMPLLALFYITASKLPDIYVILALAAGFLGDVFLLNEGSPQRLKLGILSFMAGHILYIVKFTFVAGGDFGIHLWQLALLIPYILYGIYVYGLLHRNLGPMKPVAILYLSVIILMSYKSLTVLTAGIFSFIPVLLGSLFFLASDSLLAYNTFVGKTKNSDLIIMLTYVIAQTLIIAGLLQG